MVIEPPTYFLHWRSRVYSIIGLLILLVVIVILAVTIGSVRIPFSTVMCMLLSKLPWVDMSPAWTGTLETIIFDIRLPRVILAGLVGSALATAGATYQGLFRNPLADPYLIGVAQGAALGAVIGFLLPPAWHSLGFGVIPLLAFCGALVSTAVVYYLARVGKTIPAATLILAGVAIGALL